MEKEGSLPVCGDINEKNTQSKQCRNSNLELLRIILILAIIAHHLVVNSEIYSYCSDLSAVGLNSVFLQLFGMWGKTAINCFVLISGYFMCTSKMTWKRYLKIYLPTKFYSFLFFIIFLIFGYETFSASRVFNVIFCNIKEINRQFTGSFLAFYLFIPFLNLIVNKFDKKQLGCLTVSLVFLFSFILTIFKQNNIFSEFAWYIVLYFVASYIRLYPNKFTESKKFSGLMLLMFVLLSFLSVVLVDFVLSKYFGVNDCYYMVSNSSKIFAFFVALFCFLFFKNFNPRYNKFVNTVASTTFGVLLIHANSDAMRTWLWNYFFNVKTLYSMPFGQLALYSVLIVVAVFIACSIIDYLRIVAIEKPLFKLLDKKEDKINSGFVRIKKFFIKVYLWIKNMFAKIV